MGRVDQLFASVFGWSFLHDLVQPFGHILDAKQATHEVRVLEIQGEDDDADEKRAHDSENDPGSRRAFVVVANLSILALW